jgi:hypothetical protein
MKFSRSAALLSLASASTTVATPGKPQVESEKFQNDIKTEK